MNQFTIDSINWLQGTFGNESRVFFDFFSFWGGPTGWLLAGALVFWLSGSKAGLRVGFSACIAGIANTLLKWSFALPRPYYLTDEEIEDFLLIEPESSVNLACYFLGYAFCGLLLLRIGDNHPSSVPHRCANVALGVPLLVAVVLATSYIEQVIGETAAEALLSLTVPTIVGIALPSLTGRFFRATL